MTMAPVFITIDERMKRGLFSPLVPQGNGLWSHHIPGTDINENVYDPRMHEKRGYGVYPRRAPHIGGYFRPSTPSTAKSCCDDCAKHARSRGLGQVDVTITPIRVGVALAMIGGAWWALRRNRRSRR